MDLEKYNGNKGLSPMIKALGSTMVKNAEPKLLRTTLSQSIARAYADSGQTVVKSDISYLISVIPNEIVTKYPTMRIDEVEIAIANGVRREYGEYFGINVLSISGFLKAYMESEERRKSMVDLSKLTLPEKASIDLVALKKEEEALIIKCFNDFKSTNNLGLSAIHVYDKLDARKLIPFSRERKLQIMEQAKANLLARSKNPQVNSVAERNAFKKQYDSLVGGTGNSSTMIKNEAKTIALKAFFIDLVEMGTEISDLIGENETS